jgi:hypothetical protein
MVTFCIFFEVETVFSGCHDDRPNVYSAEGSCSCNPPVYKRASKVSIHSTHNSSGILWFSHYHSLVLWLFNILWLTVVRNFNCKLSINLVQARPHYNIKHKTILHKIIEVVLWSFCSCSWVIKLVAWHLPTLNTPCDHNNSIEFCEQSCVSGMMAVHIRFKHSNNSNMFFIS